MPNENNKSGEQKAAEADVDDFSKGLGPFVVAAETTRMAMVFTDAKASGDPIIFANDSFIDLTGYPREEVLGQSFNFLMARGADPDAVAALEKALQSNSNNSGDDPEIRYRRKDGSVFWATVLVNPVRDKAGDVVQHFASFMDTTRHKEEEDRLHFLLDELNHRTQNTLITVLGIASQTLHGVADQAVVATFEGRIMALSKAQSLLGSRNWEDVGMRDLIDQILEPFGLRDGRAIHFSVAGENVRLPPKAALSLAMVFHELATNAMKHGALSIDGAGLIKTAWRIEPTAQGDQLRLRWQESGGPPVTPPSRDGFGSRLIQRGLAKELDGEVRLDYEPAGMVCEIIMPAPPGVLNEQ
jgi:PAS domain S-box-containing protein